MQIRCPHCRNSIEIVSDETLREVDCPGCGSSFSLVPEDDTGTRLPGKRTRISHFEFLERLGIGAHGSVWKALDTELDRLVAVKIPRSRHLSSAEAEAFLREARAAAQLSHRHIVSVHEVGRDEETYFIVSDLVEGVTLSSWLTARSPSFEESVRLCRQVAEALDHAHQAGVIHRDLKPSNIMIDQQEQPLLMDFGLAKRQAGEITMTIDGQVLGTPAYMSPEQARGEGHQSDARSDIYSLGVILYELLAGELPFRGDTEMLLYQVLHDEPPIPRTLNHRIPRDLETITLKCLQKDPGQRYQSAVELSADLDRFLENEPILARPVGRIQRAWRWMARNRRVAVLSAALASMFVVGFVAVTLQWLRAERERLAAVDARGQANRESRQATESRDIAIEERRRAEEATKRVRRRAYASDMLLAQRDWEEADIANLIERLGRYRTDDELKGFEWGYWNRLLHSDLLTLNGRFGQLIDVSMHGKRIVSHDLSTITMWNIDTGEVVFTVESKLGSNSRLALSPDGKRIVGGGHDVLKVWDAVAGQELFTFNVKSLGPRSLNFSPDGQQVVSGNGDKTVRTWNLETGQQGLVLYGHEDPVSCAAFSLDGKNIVSCSSGSVKTWDVETGQSIRTLVLNQESSVVHDSPFRQSGLAFSPDGTRIVASVADSKSNPYPNVLDTRVWDVETGKQIVALQESSKGVSYVAYNPGGTRIAGVTESNIIKIWNAETGQLELVLKGHRIITTGVRFSRDGQRIVSSGQNTVKVWDAITGQKTPTIQVRTRGPFKNIAISPDGQRIVVGGGMVTIWDADTGEDVRSLQSPGVDGQYPNENSCVAYSPDGKRIAGGGTGKTVRVWDAETGQEMLSLKFDVRNIWNVAYSPDGKRIASGGSEGRVKVWDAHTGEENLTIKTTISSGRNLAFSPDGKQIICGNRYAGVVEVWDADTGQLVFEFAAHIDRDVGIGVQCLAISPDGKQIASGGRDWTVKVWDAETGQQTLTLKGHRYIVTGVAFSPDGKRIVSGGEDGLLKIWDSVTGQETLTLTEESGVVRDVTNRVGALAFSPDGTRIVSRSFWGVMKIWDARPPETRTPGVRRKMSGLDNEFPTSLEKMWVRPRPPPNEKEKAFLSAASVGDLDVVKSLLAEGVWVDIYKSPEGRTALYLAASNNHKNIVGFLIDNKAYLDAGAGIYGTPLSIAAYKGHLEIVQMLIASGADVDAKANSGIRPLDIATEEAAKILRIYEANP